MLQYAVYTNVVQFPVGLSISLTTFLQKEKKILIAAIFLKALRSR